MVAVNVPSFKVALHGGHFFLAIVNLAVAVAFATRYPVILRSAEYKTASGFCRAQATFSLPIF